MHRFENYRAGNTATRGVAREAWVGLALMKTLSAAPNMSALAAMHQNRYFEASIAAPGPIQLFHNQLAKASSGRIGKPRTGARQSI